MNPKIVVFAIISILIIPNESNCQDDFKFFKKKFHKILRKYPEPLNDFDGDGIDDKLEKRIGTNSENPDTDNDGLDDYLEVFKYGTNPVEKDSDKDGKIDSLWTERYEYSNVIKITAQVGRPFDVESMSAFHFDAKLIKRHQDYVIVEYIVYPLVEPYLVPLKRTENNKFPSKYLNKDTLTRLSGNQLEEIKNVVNSAKSDLEKTILLINYLRENYKLKDKLFAQTEPLMEILVTNNNIIQVHKDWSPDELYQKYDFVSVLNLNCISNEMIKNKSRGACGSTATLIAGIFKSVGIPARIKQNFPFVTIKDSSQVVLIRKIKSKISILDKYRGGMNGDNHFFNEIFINGHWIDLDNYRLGNKWQNRPYLKSIHFNNWSDIDFANEWKPWIAYDKKSAESLKIRYKAYKTLSIEELNPKNQLKIQK